MLHHTSSMHKKSSFVEILNRFYPAFFAIGFLIIAIPIITYAYFTNDLGSKDRIMNRNDEGVVLLDRYNKPFYTFYEGKTKTIVPLSSIPKHMQQAVIAIEDKDFYRHPGFSITSIIRAFLVNFQKKEITQGGSTITQQLVKNALLNPKRDLVRKYQEIVLAEEIERRYKKDEILEMYLNSVYFGEGAVGIEEAAQRYFGKSAQDLNLAESALLAGILPAPSVYSPISGDKNEAFVRQRLVLEKMLEQNYISVKEKQAAQETNLHFYMDDEGINTYGTHFALMVRKKLIDMYGEEEVIRSGFKVKTTLNSDWQEYAEQTVKNQVEKLKDNKVSNGAAVVMDSKTGEILSLVGSHDWNDTSNGKVNIALSPRQPGSAFKPIVYAAAFERRIITPITMLRDESTTFTGGYKPVNYDGKFRGQVTVRRALSNSLNIPAVHVISRVGLINTLTIAERLGITSLQDPSQYGLSLVLGGGEVSLLEMTSAYAVFANQGIYNEPVIITEIRDKGNKIIFRHTPQSKEVLDPSISFLISSILSDTSARAETFGNALTISRPAAVKTGTTDNYKDSLTLGYTPSLTIGVWVGNNEGTPMDNIAGSLGAAPIWKNLMEQYLKGTKVEKFVVPANVIRRTICMNKLIKKDNEEKTETYLIQEYFLKGTEPKTNCTIPTISPTTGNPAENVMSLTPSPIPTNERKENSMNDSVRRYKIKKRA
jgi:1A family penicillin-binding protein